MNITRSEFLAAFASAVASPPALVGAGRGLLAARNVAFGAGAPKPYDFEVEWIGGDGSAYIDTGVKATKYSALDFAFATSVIDCPVCGFRKSATEENVECDVSAAGNYIFDFGNYLLYRVGIGSVFGLNRRIDCRIARNSYAFATPGGVVTPYYDHFPYNGPEFVQSGNLLLFRIGGSPRAQPKQGVKFYRFRVDDTAEAATLIDLVPVRVGVEGAMYDRVSGRLFRNAGTGAFQIGPDL